MIVMEVVMLVMVAVMFRDGDIDGSGVSCRTYGNVVSFQW